MRWFGFAFFICSSVYGIEHVYLKTPGISQQEVIGMSAGVRPFRKSGVRIETDTLSDKLLIHNYGYGGSGLTLSFGGAKEVLDLMAEHRPSSNVVAVLGAGVIGLSTAYDLLDNGYEVHIYSDAWSPSLTSNVAAGIWSPLSYPQDLPEEKKKLHQKLLYTSEQRFLNSIGSDPEFDGVRMITSYVFKSEGTYVSTRTEQKGEEVIVHFDNGVTKKGRRVNELGIEGHLFIQDLYAKVKSKGAKLLHKHFGSLDDILALEESSIVNCMSMGSRELFDDREFVPARGQIIYFAPQDGIDYLLFQNVPDKANTWVSLYPWSDRLILGGIYEFGEETPEITQKVISDIIHNAQKCLAGEL